MRAFIRPFILIAGVTALGGGAAGQEAGLVIELTVGQTGRTIFRCTDPNGFRSETVDCSGNVVETECVGGIVVVDRDSGGACITDQGTEADGAVLDDAQQKARDTLVGAQ